MFGIIIHIYTCHKTSLTVYTEFIHPHVHTYIIKYFSLKWETQFQIVTINMYVAVPDKCIIDKLAAILITQLVPSKWINLRMVCMYICNYRIAIFLTVTHKDYTKFTWSNSCYNQGGIKRRHSCTIYSCYYNFICSVTW